MDDSSLFRKGGELQSLIEILPQRPLTEHVLSRLECGCNQISMLGNLDHDTDQVDIRMPRQLSTVRERQTGAAPLGGFARRFLVSAGNRDDLDTRDRLESRDMSSRGPLSWRPCSNQTDAESPADASARLTSQTPRPLRSCCGPGARR